MPKIEVSKHQKPPIGGMGGSIHNWERGKHPFSRECMPNEFKQMFVKTPASEGWLALDWCGNVIGFLSDGTKIND